MYLIKDHKNEMRKNKREKRRAKPQNLKFSPNLKLFFKKFLKILQRMKQGGLFHQKQH